MRQVVVVLALALVGIHCAAPTEDDAETAEPALTAPDTTTPARPAPQEQTPSDSYTPPNVEVPGLAALVKSGTQPVPTSTVKDAYGSTYVTGTFQNRVVIGDTTLRSRGAKDVFLLKMSPTGTLLWVKGIGSMWEESSPRISLSEDAAKLTVVGMTDGAMDCGAGPLPTWSSETFFLCQFGRVDGEALASGVFPTGHP